jgi:hypothetical protein
MLKKTIFYLLMLGFMLLTLEGFSFIAVQLVDADDLFDTRGSVYIQLNEESLSMFNSQNGDPVIGWSNRGARFNEEPNCSGQPVSYSYNEAGARLYDGFDVLDTRIITVGDSYTNGDEVVDSQAYPARLSSILDVSVANHGVGGHGPVQSLLNLQKNIARYPQAQTVVLGIMYENLYRMMNSYRPVLYSASSAYALKPYMKDGEIVPHPGTEALVSISAVKAAADYSFDHDFWARPVVGFPYLASLVRALSSNYFYYRKLQREFRKVGKPEYFLTFTAIDIEYNLIALLNHYADVSKKLGLQPVAIFIPRNAHDTTSATGFIGRNRSVIDPDLMLGNVGEFPDANWTDYNLHEEDSDNTCHPSPYGYEMIAHFVAQLLQESSGQL